MSQKIVHILDRRFLNDDTFILRFEKNNLKFKTGQIVLVGKKNSTKREYSIYSSENEDFFEILVIKVRDGIVSNFLADARIGSQIGIDGPAGFFALQMKENIHHLFIATGTGISPFHSFVKTYPNFNYTILHGISFKNQEYEKDSFKNYTSCISKEKIEGYSNCRVTTYLKSNLNLIQDNTYIYICGNHKMIYDIIDILKEINFPISKVQSEIFF